MNYKKYLILLLSVFMLIAYAKKLPVDDIQKQVDKKNLLWCTIFAPDRNLKINTKQEDLDRYQRIYNDGRKYFLSKNDLKKAYGMDELYQLLVA